MGKGYFITGTDTGVGKTVVTAALATVLHKRGFKVGVMKPVETGCKREHGQFWPEDALFLRSVAGCSAPLALIAPYTFAEPLAPALAAEREGSKIEIGTIRSCYERLQAEHDIVLVEGAGGWLVPINEDLTMQDIAIELHLPVFIVARNVLGMINHTALTVANVRQRCAILGVIINDTRPADPLDIAVQTNEEALKRWVHVPSYCHFPFQPAISEESLLSLGELLLTDHLLEAMGISIPLLASGHTHTYQNGGNQ
jgi:dethiobiotin synthetase